VIALTFASFATSSQAAIIVSSGESTVFQETFADNSNSWTNVSVVNGTGTAATTTAAIGSGEWSPSVIADGGLVRSVYTLASALDVYDGDISLYMRVRKDNLSGDPDASRFDIKLSESTGNRFISLRVRPGASGLIEYRNSGGGGANTSTSSTTFPDTTNYIDFKVMLTPGATLGDGATAEAFRYNTGTSSYDSLGTVSGLVDLQTGLFNQLEISNRNATNGAIHFDEVLVTQIPEPSTMALFGVFALSAILLNRNKKQR